LSDYTTTAIRIRPSGGALGADIEGVDLSRSLDTSTIDGIRNAWLDHLVVRFRGQSLKLDDLERFSAYFGPLDRAPITPTTGLPHIPDHPNVAVMSNIIENGQPIGSLGNGEAIWHTDMSYKEDTPSASILYSVEIPKEGGNTNFANMCRAYEALPADLRARVDAGLQCKHDASTNSAGQRRAGFEGMDDPRELPGAVHPVVRTHPETGRKCLFLGRRRNAYLMGLPLDESEALLDALWAAAVDPIAIWSQRWQVGDVLMWDNRAVIHHRDAFQAADRRLMWRTQLQGDRPY
jgi:taurine dioxygenase